MHVPHMVSQRKSITKFFVADLTKMLFWLIMGSTGVKVQPLLGLEQLWTNSTIEDLSVFVVNSLGMSVKCEFHSKASLANLTLKRFYCLMNGVDMPLQVAQQSELLCAGFAGVGFILFVNCPHVPFKVTKVPESLATDWTNEVLDIFMNHLNVLVQ